MIFNFDGITLIAIFLYVLFLIVILLLDNRSPQSFLAWMLILILLPPVGIILYIFVGKNWRKAKNKIMQYSPEDTIKSYYLKDIKKQESDINAIPKHSSDYNISMIANTCLRTSSAMLTKNNNIKIYFQGENYFDDLIEALEKAQAHIHIETFILHSDTLGLKLKEILIKKAREGIAVRVIADGLGCMFKIHDGYVKNLKKAGVEFFYFHDPLSPFFAKYINYRNHRKIIVIDGMTAFTGGMNIGLEYINGGKYFKNWRDTHIRLKGESVLYLQNIFLSDWDNLNKRKASDYPSIMDDIVNVSAGYNIDEYLPIQIISSGPDSRWDAIHIVYSRMITEARKYVYIQSPYFIPDDGIFHDMINTSLSGVEVSLMITGVPDKPVAWWAAHTYFSKLLEAGVKIYLYKKGFLHSKNVIIDDNVVSVGSCNMDIRSLLLHYEVNAVIYDSDITLQFKNQFLNDIKDCEEITLAVWTKRNIFVRLRNSLCRIISPLL